MKKLFSPVFPHKPILIFATIALFISFTLLSPSIISAQSPEPTQWILCADDKDELCDNDSRALNNGIDSTWGCVQRESCAYNDDQIGTFSSEEECEEARTIYVTACKNSASSISLSEGNIEGMFNNMNPVTVCVNTPVLACVVNIVVSKIIFPACGILLLIMIIWGGLKMVQGSFTGNQNAIDLGRKRVIGAIYGYLLLAVSYLLWRVVEMVFGFTITG
jgi:hypothetical protein